MSSEVEETLKRINSHKGVKGVLIMNSEGTSHLQHVICVILRWKAAVTRKTAYSIYLLSDNSSHCTWPYYFTRLQAFVQFFNWKYPRYSNSIEFIRWGYGKLRSTGVSASDQGAPRREVPNYRSFITTYKDYPRCFWRIHMIVNVVEHVFFLTKLSPFFIHIDIVHYPQ